MNGVQTRLKCKPNVKQCKRLVFPARSALFNHNILNTKAISHFQANHILIRFVFPPLITYNDIRIYGLDRIEKLTITDERFCLPKDFSAAEYFSSYYGVVTGYDLKPEQIVIRAYRDHIPYLQSLPLHHSQRLLEDNGEYADFELSLAPTYDFVMRLLHVGAMIEVISPTSLRKTMKGWISDMYNLYKND